MTFPYFHHNSKEDKSAEPPFAIVIEHRDKTHGGHWRPEAFIRFGHSLRTSDFLLALPPDELQSFLLLLSFISPSGDCLPTLPQLAAALQQPQAKTRRRMDRLIAARWQGQAIVVPYHSGNGTEAFRLADGLVPVQEETAEKQEVQAALYKAAPREAVIEHSRHSYGRRRAEVEREIARLNGWELPDTTEPEIEPAAVENTQHEANEQRHLQRQLENAGLTRDQAQRLVASFNAERIERQLAWLPYRRAKNPAGLLLAAIEGDYEPPALLRKAGSDAPSEVDPPNANT